MMMKLLYASYASEGTERKRYLKINVILFHTLDISKGIQDMIGIFLELISAETTSFN